MKNKITIAEQKLQASKILNGLAAIADRPLDKKGNLDVKAFNELPEVIKAKRKLTDLGITRKFLWKYFLAAGMILTFKKDL